MGARKRAGIGLPYRPARLHRLVELIPWNRSWAPWKFRNTGSGRPVRQPYYYSVSSPHRLFKNSSTVLQYHLMRILLGCAQTPLPNQIIKEKPSQSVIYVYSWRGIRKCLNSLTRKKIIIQMNLQIKNTSYIFQLLKHLRHCLNTILSTKKKLT